MLTKKDFSIDKKKDFSTTKKKTFPIVIFVSEFAQNWCTESLEPPDQEYQLGFRMRLLERN